MAYQSRSTIDVMMTAPRPRSRRFAQSPLNAMLAKADLAEDASVRAMVAEVARRFGKIDLLIANAAATAFKPLLEVKPHNVARTFDLSVGGFLAMVQES